MNSTTSNIYISDHAYIRAKERCGWNKKTTARMVEKVVAQGTPANNAKGLIALWIKNRTGYTNTNTFIIYGNNLFVFAQNVLVTVLTIPSRASMQTILRKKNVSGFAEA